jgi:hypothetical protein
MLRVTMTPQQRQQTIKAAAVTNTSGQGKVFLYDEKAQSGSIKGFDRNDYTFAYAEWKNKNEKPKIGMIVNFDIGANKEAVSIKIR